ncbi:hypothetical protein GWN65_01395 [Candidatus Bathyarchaeota archaeon]|nr:hypothetical protein [Candidatus Bathyarchaeota archaeon]NIV43606.1 hypothetical protein [Candidatus Bathyarchaeota archaeon]
MVEVELYETANEETKRLRAELADLKEQIVDLTERNRKSKRGIHVNIGPVFLFKLKETVIE